MTGRYQITGVAAGFNTDNSSADATKTFAIKVAC